MFVILIKLLPLLQTKQKTDTSNTQEDPITFPYKSGEYYNREISLWELTYAIKLTKERTSGHGNFHICLLKNVLSIILNFLLQIFNKIWTENVFLEAWRLSIIISVVKSKKNPLFVDSYRPILLTSVPCKVFEKIIHFHLNWLLETNIYLWSQYGFEHNRSILHQLYALQ